MKHTNRLKKAALKLCASLVLSPAIASAGNVHLVPLTGYDADADGAVTVEEFTAAASAEVEAGVGEFLVKYDADGDGVVSTAEARAVFAFVAADWLEDISQMKTRSPPVFGATTGTFPGGMLHTSK